LLHEVQEDGQILSVPGLVGRGTPLLLLLAEEPVEDRVHNSAPHRRIHCLSFLWHFRNLQSQNALAEESKTARAVILDGRG
jgi:hypothetical protein